jgi:class 3 adenylate cyclase
MSKSTRLRWIEQAEARAVREHAALQRAASEAQLNISYSPTTLAWPDWLRELARALGCTVAAAPSLSVGAALRVKARFRASLRAASAGADCDRTLVAVLITDIAGSTKRVVEIGDREWRALLDQHDRATRSQITRFGGRVVGNHGDGFVGIFDSPARAIRCATAIADTITPLGLQLRSGIHVGEVHLKKARISGIAVHVAARITATARSGETRVSKMVRDLAAGSGLVFEDLGIHRLRSLPEEIHLYAMRAADAPPCGIAGVGNE